MQLPSWVELHGAITHFPIALLFAAFAYEAGAAIWHKREWRIVSFWLLVAAVVMVVPALATGWLAGYIFTAGSAEPPRIFVVHRLVAFVTGGLALVLLLWRVKAKDQLSDKALTASMVLTVLIAGVVGYTGYLGGEMVFGGTTAAGAGTRPVTGAAETPTLQPMPKLDPALVAIGEKLFRAQDNGCVGCHRMNGQGGTRGPDLTHEGQQGHGLNWQIDHLKNPQKMSPGSTMPDFADLKPAELKALAAYLVTRR